MADDDPVVPAHQAFETLLTNLEADKKSKITRERVADVLVRIITAAPHLKPSQTEIAHGKSQGKPFIPVPYLVPPDSVSRVITALRAGAETPIQNGLPGPELIKAEDSKADRPGRPYTPLTLQSPKWAMVGVKLGHRGGRVCELAVLVTQLDGTPLDLPDKQGSRQPYIVPDFSASTPAELADALGGVIETLCDCETVRDRYILGVGVEVAGHVFEGSIVDASLNNLYGVELGRLLSDRLDATLAKRLDGLLGRHCPLPVVVDNDLNVLAVLETYKPRSPERNIAIIAVFDDGVGSALIVDGRVYRGGNGMAGEIGHINVFLAERSPSAPALTAQRRQDPRDSGRRLGFSDPCYCGAPVGHLDCYAPSERICGELDINLEQFEKVAATAACTHDGKGTPEAEAFRTAGGALGTALTSVINLVNPSRILLFLPPALANAQPGTAGEQYLKQAATVTRAQVFSNAAKHTILRVSALENSERKFLGAQAAAIRVIDSLIHHAKHRCRCYTPKVQLGISDDAAASESLDDFLVNRDWA